jgi:hypothetical protein
VNNFFADDASINGNFWKSDDQMRELEELMANVLMCEPGTLPQLQHSLIRTCHQFHFLAY